MELNDITEILNKSEINPQNVVDILSYLKNKGVKEIVARYKIDFFKFPIYGNHAKEPIKELISVIKTHIYDGTGNIQYDGEKYTINLESLPGKVSEIFTCRDKMEIIIDKI